MGVVLWGLESTSASRIYHNVENKLHLRITGIKEVAELRSAISLAYCEINHNMKLLLISLGLVTLAVQIFCQEAVAPTKVGETNELPAGALINQAQAVQEPSQTEDRKLTKRSHGWGWPAYGYGWPWPGWGGHGGYGGYGGHGGGWYGGWYGGHGWPWWYSGYGSGWHSKW